MRNSSQTASCVAYLDSGPWFGGAQHSLLTLVNGVESASDFDVVVMSADGTRGGLVEQLRRHRTECIEVSLRHWRRSPLGIVQFLLDCRRLRKAFADRFTQEPPGLVHANSVRAGLLATVALPRTIPLAVHDRDLHMPAFARRKVGRRAAAIFAVSRTVRDQWQGIEGPDPVVLPNPFDVDAIADARPVAQLSPDGGAYHVLLVADLVPWKRHGLFLDALALARQRNRRVRGVIIGRPVGASGQRTLTRLRRRAEAAGLHGHVEFLTDCNNALPWIAAGDVLVNTSDREPFGRTVVEALALGKPVVSTRCGGPAELLSDCRAGTLADPTAEGLAEAILRWECPVQRLSIYHSARNHAERYDSRRVIPRLLQHYSGLTGAA